MFGAARFEDAAGIDKVMSVLEAHRPVDIDEGSEMLEPGVVPPVGLRAGEAMPTDSLGQPNAAPQERVMGGAERILTESAERPGVASSHPSGHVAPAVPQEVAPKA